MEDQSRQSASPDSSLGGFALSASLDRGLGWGLRGCSRAGREFWVVVFSGFDVTDLEVQGI